MEYKALRELENGEVMSEPLNALAVDNPVTFDIIVRSHRCFSIASAVLFFSSFCALQTSGHLECVLYIYEYISRIKLAMLQFRAGKPSFL